MQKFILFLFLSVLFFLACNQNQTTVLHGPQKLKGQVYGDSITDQSIKDVILLSGIIEENSVQKLKVTGIVENVCSENGCWLSIRVNNEQLLRVTFKDNAFFVPKNIIGKKVVVEGEAKSDSVFIANKQHLAHISTSEKEFASIANEKKQHLTFEAKGLVVL